MAEEETKPWWRSKTIWVNLIALIALIAQGMFGFVISVEEQAAIIIFINLILRAITNEGLALKAK